MLILGIETSLPQGMVFVGEGERILVSRSFSSHHSSRELVPTIQSLLEKTKISKSSVGVVVVSRGPGSFTGIRIGISLAKSLSFCLNLPLVGVPVLDCLAFATPCSGYLCSLIEGYAGNFFTAFFEKRGEKVEKISDYLFLPLEEILNRACELLPRRVIFIPSPGSPLNITKIKQNFSLFKGKIHLDRAFLKWGLESFASGRFDDPLTLSPIYVSQPRIGEVKNGRSK